MYRSSTRICVSHYNCASVSRDGRAPQSHSAEIGKVAMARSESLLARLAKWQHGGTGNTLKRRPECARAGVAVRSRVLAFALLLLPAPN
jgi:hypothetical protein